MKPATHAALDNEQNAFHSKLLQAVSQINEADTLLTNGGEGMAATATAHLLSAIAKVYVVETAEKYNMATRLTAFTKAVSGAI